MSDYTLREKMRVLSNLFVFEGVTFKADGKRIDTDCPKGNVSFIWTVATRYMYDNRMPTKSDLKYINEVVSKLIFITQPNYPKLQRLTTLEVQEHFNNATFEFSAQYNALLKFITEIRGRKNTL